MHLILAAVVFVLVFGINLAHLRARRIPLYSWGTVIAAIHIAAGFVSWMAIPVAAILVSLVIEAMNGLMQPGERQALDRKYERENHEAEQRIEDAQGKYAELECLQSYTVEDEYRYRRDLRLLGDAGIWHFERGGLVTSILVKPGDLERAAAVIGLEPEVRDGPAP